MYLELVGKGLTGFLETSLVTVWVLSILHSALESGFGSLPQYLCATHANAPSASAGLSLKQT